MHLPPRLNCVIHLRITALLCSFLAACSGGSQTSSSIYSVGGSVTGLSGTLVIQNNASDTLTLDSATAFVFTSRLNIGSTYNVTVLTQPVGQVCSINNATGIVQLNNIANVLINCVTAVHSLAGSITVAANTVVDNDVNDPLASYASNDNVALAQSLGNPVTLGGFVSAAGTGNPGDRFESASDYDDYFAVTLAAGQSISLSISDYNTAQPTAIDLDLFLYDAAGTTLIDSAEGTNATETLTIASSGRYILVVSAANGISNYTINIGAQTLGANTLDLTLSDEFVAGDIIVQFHQPSAIATTQSKSQVSSIGLQTKAGKENRTMLFAMGNQSERKKLLTNFGITARAQKKLVHTSQPDVQYKRETFRAIKELRKRPDVLSADLNYIRKAMTTPNDTYYNLQWHYPLINLPQAWDVTTGSSNVIVAVIDTGAFMTHPDLAANLTNTGYDFISSSTYSNDGDGIDNNPDDPGDSTTIGQSSWHGTHVAGTIAAVSNNNSGVSGIAWSSRIMPLRALGIGGGTSYDIIQAVRYAAQLSNDSATVPAEKADIINLSLGSSGSSGAEQAAFTAARNAGIIIIAAAGNSNSNQLFYPASYAGVVSVSAVDSHSVKAPYSNFGSAVDIAAPGGDATVDDNNDGYADGILSTLLSDASGSRQPNFTFYQGTSMAAPHIAGVAALMVSVRKNAASTLSPAEFDSLLVSGNITTDPGTTGRDDIYGYGLIDAFAAVQAVSASAPTTLVVSPVSLNFGVVSGSANLTVTVSKSGSGNITINSITSSDSWLTITPDSVDADGIGTYTATVSSGVLADGIYAGTLTFNSDAGDFAISANAQIGNNVSSSLNAGYLYVLLINPVTFETVNLQELTAVNNEYNFDFSNVPHGDYIVIAGSDMDNDFVICDAGEACGAYPIMSAELSVVSVTENTTGIDFSVSFSSGISATQLLDGDKANPFRRLMTTTEHVKQ